MQSLAKPVPPLSDVMAARIRLQQRMDRGEITLSQAMAELRAMQGAAKPGAKG